MSKYVNEVGSFLCQVVEPPNGQWFGEIGEKQTPFIGIRCVVNDEASSQHGAEITYKAWLSDGAFDRTIKDLAEVFGFDGDLAALESGDNSFVGMECVVVTETDTYTDKDGKAKDGIKAKWLNPVGRQSSGAPAMAKEKVSSLIAKLNSRSKAIAKTAAQATPPTSKPASQPAPKGGSPF